MDRRHLTLPSPVRLECRVSPQTPADDIRGRVKVRQKVVVTEAQGRELTGRVIQMTDTVLTVQQKGSSVDVSYSDIVSIDRPKDRLGNGALFGLAVGAALGAALGTSDGSPDSDSPFCGMGFLDDCGKHNVAAAVLATGAVGTLIGVSVDALIRHDRHLYRRSTTQLRIAPAFSRRGAGALVAVSW